jgi:hypothetical protein
MNVSYFSLDEPITNIDEITDEELLKEMEPIKRVKIIKEVAWGKLIFGLALVYFFLFHMNNKKPPVLQRVSVNV